MRLILTVTSDERHQMGANARREFDASGGTIGRNASCTWVLSDPTLTMSARHATIVCDGRGFFIIDTSTNGVFVNTVKTPIGRGLSRPILDGDTIYLAHFVISVAVVEDELEARRRAGVGAMAISVRSEPHLAALPSDLGASADNSIEIPPLIVAGAAPVSPSAGRPEPIAYEELPPSEPSSVAAEAVRTAPAAAIPADFWNDVMKPLAVPAVTPVSSGVLDAIDFSGLGLHQAAAAPVGPALTPISPPAAEPAPALVAALAPLPQTAVSEPSAEAEPASSAAPPSPGEIAVPMPLPGGRTRPATQAILGETPPANRPSQGAVALHAAQEIPDRPAPIDPLAILRQRAAGHARSQRALEEAATPSTATVAAAPSPAPFPRARSLDGAVPPVSEDSSAAFWKGLGLDAQSVPAELREDLMAECGRALRETIQGLVSILSSRRSIKSEFRVEQTSLQPRENNPLKFLPSGEAVLKQFVQRERSGFLPLSAAVREGLNDLKSHEVATVIALQAVAHKILANFDPKAIEAQAGPSTRLFGRGPDRAKLWEAYERTHASLAGNLEKTAQELVSHEFARAYSEQSDAFEKGSGD